MNQTLFSQTDLLLLNISLMLISLCFSLLCKVQDRCYLPLMMFFFITMKQNLLSRTYTRRVKGGGYCVTSLASVDAGRESGAVALCLPTAEWYLLWQTAKCSLILACDANCQVQQLLWCGIPNVALQKNQTHPSYVDVTWWMAALSIHDNNSQLADSCWKV